VNFTNQTNQMSTNFGMPGPGGSLGQCALCGKPFLKEILTGQTVKSFRIDSCDQTLYGHSDCIANCPKDILNLPEASPIRQAFERLNQKTAA
jgi:ferredoxin